MKGLFFSFIFFLAMGFIVNAASFEKPNVTILGTGGTIAGSSDSKTDTTYYKAGALGVDSLIETIPELNDVAILKSEQITNLDSNDITNDILLLLSKKINQLLTVGNQDGVVVTHGTDTLEESAFFMDITVNNTKPVVFMGAMRPATALSADGPMNLLQAVSLAGSKAAQNRGTMIMLNDQIDSAYYTTKTNSITTDAFKAPLVGYLGIFTNKGPMFFYTPAKPTNKPYFDVSKITSLPRVDIIYVYQNQDDIYLRTSIAEGAQGIVIDATGNGNMPKPLEKAIMKLTQRGYPIVISTRTGSGYVSSKPYAINSGFLNAQKSRILLQLALASGATAPQIRSYFDSI